MTDELKACPLCGSSARVYDDGYGDLDSVPAWIAACDDEDGCGCQTTFFDMREEAVAAWNRRAERTCRKVPGRMKYGRRMPECSECGQSLGDKRWKYCPNCGAKVVGDDEA